MGKHDTGLRGFWSAAIRTRKHIASLALAIFALAAGATWNAAQAQTLSAQKWLCAGLPSSSTPLTCTHVGSIPANSPAFYVFQVTSLPGAPQQNVTISEINGPGSSPAWPTGFVVTAINCTAGSATVATTTTPTTINFIVQPNTTVTCTAAGSFTVQGPAPNTAHVSSNQGSIPNIFWNTNVTSSTALGADLEIHKSASTNFVTAPGAVNYTVTITNNGPNSVPLAPWFTFHDTLALLPNSVPLYATLLPNWYCTGSQCPTAGPSSVTSPLLVGTSAPHSFFDWSFATSSGVLAPNTSVVLHFTVQFTAIPGLNCKKQPGYPDGLSNTGFFTLTNANSAAYDSYAPNNTSTANVTVDTGATTVNPNCGDGQLTLRKIQTFPITSPVLWGAANPVSYDLIIQNTSIPAQPIRILPGQIRDLVTEGVNTPPFTRRFMGIGCNSNQPNICAQILPGNGTPPFQYSYYGQTDQGWSGPSFPPPWIILNYNRTITLHITFVYENPDCDSVPLANPKPIDNTVTVDYLAPALGAPLSSPPVQFHQSASVTTDMAPPPETCKFKVTKKLVSGGPNVHFGPGTPLIYSVTFTNNDAPRTIGTIADMLRITDINYASPLTYTALWTCTQTGGVAVFGNGGPVPGQAIYTGSPAQGAIVFTQPSLISQPPVFFPTNSTLTCQVQITVNRPPYGSPNCSSIPADLENAGIMDTTRPYNPNGFWPPSGIYNPANTMNPQPQDKNWATVRTPLPKCFDLVINKSASVAGVSPAWTYPGGPAIDYTITATNPTNSLLTGQFTGSTANGLVLTDTIAPPPYTASMSTTPCSSNMGCFPLLSGPITQAVGITSLAAQASGDWYLTASGPFIAGQSVNNCAHVKISGDYANPNDWYSNFNPSQPAPNAQTSCVSVPVLDVRPLSVLKRVVNNTGGTVYFSFAQSFAVQVACSPYSIPASQSSGTITMPPGAPIPNGGSAMGGPWTSPFVPVGDQCTVSETPPPPPILTKQPCPMGSYLQWLTSYSPTQPITISASAANVVTVTNTLYCHRPLLGQISVTKIFVNATNIGTNVLATYPALFFGVDVTCNGQTTSNVLTTPPTSGMSTSPPWTLPGVPVGTQCQVIENPNPPPIPSLAYKVCSAHNYGIPKWTVTITPSAPFNVTVGANSVTIVNKLSCDPNPTAAIKVMKIFDNQTNSAVGPLVFNVTVGCPYAPVFGPPLQTPTTAAGASSSSAPATMPPVLVGSSCNVQEPTLPTVNCTVNGVAGTPIWQTTFLPGSSFQVQSSGNVLTITNTLTCQPVLSKDNLNLIKTFTNQTMDQTMQFGPLTFNVQVNCSDGQSFVAPVTTPQTNSTSSSPAGAPVTSALYGTTCTFSEPSLGIPSNAALACRDPATGVQEIPTWQVTFTPPVTTMVPGGVTEQVDNVLTCVPGPIPPHGGNSTPVSGAARPQAGSSPQAPGPSVPECETISVNGETKATCICPKGTKLKDNRCIKKKSALEDILGHVTIGVGVGVGGGSHGSKPKGEKPPVNGEDGR